MLMAMESSCILNKTSPALPADLNHFSVFNQERHGALTARKVQHSGAGARVGFDVMLGIIVTLPFEPFAHFTGVGTGGGSEEFVFRHEYSPGFREECDTWRLALPECGECNRS